MDGRMTAIIVCLALASMPAPVRAAKVHKLIQAAPKTAHKAVQKAAANKPAGQKAPAAIANAYAAVSLQERLAIQSDLAWLGYYDGAPGGDFGDQRVVDAVKLLQKANKAKDTGILDDEERARLSAAAQPAQRAVGWKLIDDPATGARFGLPKKLVSPLGPSRTGSRWVSGHGQIQIDDFRLSEASLPALFAEEKKAPRGRYVDWSMLQPDSFVISGTQGLKNFVVRAEASGRQVRGITILYDQATAGIMAPVAIATANSFQGFPDPNAVPPGQQRAVEYDTAIVVDKSGDLITARQGASDCAVITVAGFGHARRIAEDKASDLALIRLYGARNLVPAALAGDSQGDDLSLVGIADPAAQDGGDAVTKAAARLNGQVLAPAPKPGFAGAAAIDAQGHFAGTVALTSPAVAGTDAVVQQATLVPATVVRAFLAAHAVAPAAGQSTIEQSVVRVICVRE